MSRGDWVLHVDRREAVLKAEAGVLTVRACGRPVERFPLRELGLIVLSGSPRIDGFTLRALGEAEVATVFVGGRQAQPPGWLAQGLAASVRLRHAQHLAYADERRRIDIARWVVGRKFAACAAVAEELGWSPLVAVMQSAATRIPACADLAALQGLEGSCAARWFEAMRKGVPEAWGFRGRERRPPPCPVNALLSYLYAVLSGEAQTAVQALGLDPAVGFLHAMVPGRSALVLDALECLRPGADAVVLRLIDSKALSPENFRVANGACVIGKEGRGVLMSAFAIARSAWPGAGLPLGRQLRSEVRQLAKVIDDRIDNAPEDYDVGDT